MLKLSHVTVAVFTITTLLPEMIFIRPLAASLPYPVVPNSDTESLVCYLQTQDGKVVNLNSLCSKKIPSGSLSVNGSNCYFVDANGRPCQLAATEFPRRAAKN